MKLKGLLNKRVFDKTKEFSMTQKCLQWNECVSDEIRGSLMKQKVSLIKQMVSDQKRVPNKTKGSPMKQDFFNEAKEFPMKRKSFQWHKSVSNETTK